ncbi:queuosine precursor transporter [Bowdeniella massiliensis]|uniref:queuosine precursor transporter n=1 Tax=Bowdeniella massiliensis TaxID=2932264 RepID=UPI002029675D
MSVHTRPEAQVAPPPAALRYDVVVTLFVGFLLLSNIAATKLIQFDIGPASLIFDGGALLFPLTYILGDVLAEVFGFARAKRAIILGFVVSIIASLTLYLVQIAPAAADYENQEAFAAVLGFVPRIVAASLAGYLVGQYLNALVLTVMKRHSENHLWARLLGSTVVGEGADTIIFCTIAFGGILTGGNLLNYILVGFAYKVGVEVMLLPITYRVIALFKRYRAGETA